MSDIKQFEPLFTDWYVDEILGKGSFGTVYKIHRDELGSRYYSAVKHFSIPASDEEVAAMRNDGYNEKSISDYYNTLVKDITAENRLMNRLKGHSNIVSIEDSKVIPKQSGTGYDIFIRMELLTSLTKAMQQKPLTRDDVIKLGIDLCSALEVCEAEEIIHRDIKPDNIFISPLGDYKLGDFGVARQLERTTAFMSKKGTYNYMAPEVYKGESYGTSCDIYSLGLVMYRLMNRGRMPFMPLPPNPIYPSDSEAALMRRIKGETLPAPADADPELTKVIIKACSVSLRNRYHSATEMKADLMRVMNGQPIPDPTVAAPVQSAAFRAHPQASGYASTNQSTAFRANAPSVYRNSAQTGVGNYGYPRPKKKSKAGKYIAALLIIGAIIFAIVMMIKNC